MLSAHLTCSFLMVGYVTATFVKERRVDTETLLRLRLHDCGKGVRRGSPIPPDPDFLLSKGEGGDSIRVVERLLTQASGAAAGGEVFPRCSGPPRP